MKRLKLLSSRLLPAFVLLLMSASLSGCSSSLAGSDAAVYSRTRLRARVQKDVEQVYSASITSLEALGITVTEKSKDVFGAKVEGETADEKVVDINIEPDDGGFTTLRIKVGTLGDRERSHIIYNRIRKELGMAEIQQLD